CSSDLEAEGKLNKVNADYVMVTVGRRPNTNDMGLEIAGIEKTDRGLVKVDNQGRTNKKNIYAIGDIVAGAALTHKASYEGKVAAEAISGKTTAVDYVAMPAVCYTDPELGTVGVTEKDAKKADRKVKVSKFPFAANGRAISLDETDGFLKLISEPETGELI